MKKTFPVIFVLIALSILGILFIQISWLQGLMFLQKNQLKISIDEKTVFFRYPFCNIFNKYFLQKNNANTLMTVFKSSLKI